MGVNKGDTRSLDYSSYIDIYIYTSLSLSLYIYIYAI